MVDKDSDFKIGEGTDITIPLRNLLSIIGGVAIAVIGYFHVDERIMLLESDVILPLDVEQNMRIEFIEKKLEEMNG